MATTFIENTQGLPINRNPFFAEDDVGWTYNGFNDPPGAVALTSWSITAVSGEGNVAQNTAGDTRFLVPDMEFSPEDQLRVHVRYKVTQDSSNGKKCVIVMTRRNYATGYGAFSDDDIELDDDAVAADGWVDKTVDFADGPNDLSKIMFQINFDDGAGAANAHVQVSKLEVVDRGHELGFVNVKQFGALGDGVTDDAGAIQDAIDYAEDHGSLAVYIPGSPSDSVVRERYVCHSALEIPANAHIFGDGPHASELRFTQDTDGIKIKSGAIRANWTIRDLHIRGSADTATASTATAGVRVGPANYFTIKNCYIQRFVDGMVFDAESTGLALGSVSQVHVASSQFPNTANGFPRYGVHFTGASKKPQAIDFHDCIVYAELNISATSLASDGAKTAFALSSLGGLSRLAGVRVYHKTASDPYPVLQVEGTDYDLYDVTGTATQITAGGLPDADIEDVEARFGTAPATGTIDLIYSDPTGSKGVYVEKGTGLVFSALTVGGWVVNVENDGDSNQFDVAYSQIADVSFKLGATADNVRIFPGEYSNKDIVTKFDVDADATGVTLSHGAGRAAQQVVLTSDYTATTSSDPIDWGDDDYLEVDVRNIGLPREVMAGLSYRMTEAVGHRVRAVYRLEVSADEGASWTMLDRAQVDRDYDGLTAITDEGRLILHAIDDAYHDSHFGELTRLRYRVTVDRLNGDSVKVLGSGDNRSFLQAAFVNPA